MPVKYSSSLGNENTTTTKNATDKRKWANHVKTKDHPK
jgi:hypothetical protein